MVSALFPAPAARRFAARCRGSHSGLFSARLLGKDYLKAAARDKGRFRTFLLVAFKRYLANEWHRQHAQKRGGFAPVVLIDQELAESRFASEPAHHLSPDLLFDRQWAMTLLERTMTQLEQGDAPATGRAQLFECLRTSSVARDEAALPYAGNCGPPQAHTEAAVKMAVRRLDVFATRKSSNTKSPKPSPAPKKSPRRKSGTSSRPLWLLERWILRLARYFRRVSLK